jgi:hypothetical protein
MPYKMRKLPNADAYKVYNTDTGEIHSKHATKKNAKAQMRLLYSLESDGEGYYPKQEQSNETAGGAIYNPNNDPKITAQNEKIRQTMQGLKPITLIHHNQIKGGKLAVKDLKGLLEGSYDARQQVGDFELDKALSTSNSKVYVNKRTGQAVVAHKGTSGITDWANNAVYALGGDWAYKKTKRYKDAEKVQKQAEAKYGAKNISTIGHSQGGLQAELLGKNTNETITLNKATRPFSNTAKSDNQHDIRVKGDVVSAFNPFQKTTSKDIVVGDNKEISLNPVKAVEKHGIDQLNQLPDEQMIGQGANHKGRKKGAKNKPKPVIYKAPPELHEVLGFHKPYTKPIGNYNTTWRWVLNHEREAQGITYPQAMKDPAIKELYYEIKDIAEEEEEGAFTIDWLEANYNKYRKGLKDFKKGATGKKGKATPPAQKQKITKFLTKPPNKENITMQITEKDDDDEEIELPPPTPAPEDIAPEVVTLKSKIEKLQQIGADKGAVPYNTSVILKTILYLEVLKKYGGNCAVLELDKKIGESRFLNSGIDIYEEMATNNRRWSQERIDRLGEILKDCLDRGADTIIFPLQLNFTNKEKEKVEYTASTHANLLIFKPEERTIERFEPHGDMYGNTALGDVVFNKFLKKLFEKDLTGFIGKVVYRSPDFLCPMIDKGWQSLEGKVASLEDEGGGFCLLWSHFLLELVCINPDASTKEIIDEANTILKDDPQYLKDVIRGYVVDAEEQVDILIKKLGGQGFKFLTKAQKDATGDDNYKQYEQYKDVLDQWAISMIMDIKGRTKEPKAQKELPPEYTPNNQARIDEWDNLRLEDLKIILDAVVANSYWSAETMSRYNTSKDKAIFFLNYLYERATKPSATADDKKILKLIQDETKRLIDALPSAFKKSNVGISEKSLAVRLKELGKDVFKVAEEIWGDYYNKVYPKQRVADIKRVAEATAKYLTKPDKTSGHNYENAVIVLKRLGGIDLLKGSGIDNMDLYNKAKQIADETYSKPSAYKSGFIVKKYKELGGTYSGKKENKGIGRWMKEEWQDIGNQEYPVYRPTKRITKDTPLTPAEIAPSNLKAQIKLKQLIKGDANLPSFVKK